MAYINNYGTRGVSDNLRLGKNGPRVVAEGDTISLRNASDTLDAALTAGTATISQGSLTLSNTSSKIIISDASLSRHDADIIKFDGPAGIVLPTGNTADRPTPTDGLVRVNTDTITESYVELHNGSEWLELVSAITAVNQTTAMMGTRLVLAQLVMRQNTVLWA